MSRSYPEHDKLAAIQEEHAAIRDFMESMMSMGYQLCRYEDSGYRSGLRNEHVVPRWMPQDWREIVSTHFDIDEMTLEQERRKMLANLTDGGAL